MTRHELRGLLAHGVLDRPCRGVYRLVGAQPTFRQRAAIAVAAHGAPVALSHLAAARLWGAEVPGAPIELTVPVSRSRRSATAIVHGGHLVPGEVVERHGLPVTSAGRTVVDLATGPDPQPDEAVLRVVDDLAGARHLSQVELAGAVAAAHVRRAHHHRHLDVLLAPVLEGNGSADSALEARYHRAVLAAGLPQPIRQHQVLVEGRVRLLDMAWPPALLALQVDGYRWHGGRRRFDDDRALDAALAELGWLVVRATSAMDPDEVAARLLRAHGRRLPVGRGMALG